MGGLRDRRSRRHRACRAGSVVVDGGAYLGAQGPRPVRQARPLAVPRPARGGAHGRSASCCSATRPPRGWSTWRGRPRPRASRYVWTFDSHLLWEEPFVIYSQILAETRKVIVGPMVTNPATRDWTVTASLFATLNEMYGNRTVCGIGRGDSAVRVLNGKPTTLATLREAIHVIRELANGRAVEHQGATPALPVGDRTAGSRSGSRRTARRRWRWPARSATASSCSSPTPPSPSGRIGAVRRAAEAGRARPRRGDDLRRGTGVRRRRPRAHARPVPLVRRHGRQPRRGHRRPLRRRRRAVPQALTDYIAGRQGYDYNEHGRAGNTHTDFVPDEIVDRFCILGPARASTSTGCEELKRARRRPVRRLPPARRQGADARGVRRDVIPAVSTSTSPPSPDPPETTLVVVRPPFDGWVNHHSGAFRAQSTTAARSRPYVGPPYAVSRAAPRSTSRCAPTSLPRSECVSPTQSCASPCHRSRSSAGTGLPAGLEHLVGRERSTLVDESSCLGQRLQRRQRHLGNGVDTGHAVRQRSTERVARPGLAGPTLGVSVALHDLDARRPHQTGTLSEATSPLPTDPVTVRELQGPAVAEDHVGRERGLGEVAARSAS